MLRTRTENENVAFSIIIPVFNKREYVERCIESITHSTCNNVEIICIDDASTDGSLEVINKYKDITVIKNDKNMGVAYSRNIGIDNAKGEYIVFLDADDYLDEYALEHIYGLVKNNDAEGCLITLIDNEGRCSIKNQYEGCFAGVELIGRLAENEEDFLYACGGVWSRDYLNRKNIRFKNLSIGEGGLFILEALVNAVTITVSDYKAYHYNINETSTCQKTDSKTLSAIGQLKQIVYLVDQLQEENDNDAIISFLQFYIKKNVGGICNLSEDDLKKYFMKDTSKDKFTAKLIKGDFLENKVNVAPDEELLIKKKGYVYVYGSGYETLNVLRFCNELKVVIMGFFVSGLKGNPPSIYGYEVKRFDENSIADKSIPFLVSAHKKHHKEIESILRDAGIETIIKVGV